MFHPGYYGTAYYGVRYWPPAGEAEIPVAKKPGGIAELWEQYRRGVRVQRPHSHKFSDEQLDRVIDTLANLIARAEAASRQKSKARKAAGFRKVAQDAIAAKHFLGHSVLPELGPGRTAFDELATAASKAVRTLKIERDVLKAGREKVKRMRRVQKTNREAVTALLLIGG